MNPNFSVLVNKAKQLLTPKPNNPAISEIRMDVNNFFCRSVQAQRLMRYIPAVKLSYLYLQNIDVNSTLTPQMPELSNGVNTNDIFDQLDIYSCYSEHSGNQSLLDLTFGKMIKEGRGKDLIQSIRAIHRSSGGFFFGEERRSSIFTGIYKNLNQVGFEKCLSAGAAEDLAGMIEGSLGIYTISPRNRTRADEICNLFKSKLPQILSLFERMVKNDKEKR